MRTAEQVRQIEERVLDAKRSMPERFHPPGVDTRLQVRTRTQASVKCRLVDDLATCDVDERCAVPEPGQLAGTEQASGSGLER